MMGLDLPCGQVDSSTSIYTKAIQIRTSSTIRREPSVSGSRLKRINKAIGRCGATCAAT